MTQTLDVRFDQQILQFDTDALETPTPRKIGLVWRVLDENRQTAHWRLPLSQSNLARAMEPATPCEPEGHVHHVASVTSYPRKVFDYCTLGSLRFPSRPHGPFLSGGQSAYVPRSHDPEVLQSLLAIEWSQDPLSSLPTPPETRVAEAAVGVGSGHQVVSVDICRVF